MPPKKQAQVISRQEQRKAKAQKQFSCKSIFAAIAIVKPQTRVIIETHQNKEIEGTVEEVDDKLKFVFYF